MLPGYKHLQPALSRMKSAWIARWQALILPIHRSEWETTDILRELQTLWLAKRRSCFWAYRLLGALSGCSRNEPHSPGNTVVPVGCVSCSSLLQSSSPFPVSTCTKHHIPALLWHTAIPITFLLCPAAKAAGLTRWRRGEDERGGFRKQEHTGRRRKHSDVKR